MGCVSPLKAYWRSRHRDAITFDVVKSSTKIPFNLPCGQCIGCRMEKARQWGLRCLHEKKMWPHSVYVTLTYNDESMPPGWSLCLRDVQLFMKRLRFEMKSTKNNPVRFFLGGEYGDENQRPHYHALLFNVAFKDARPFSKNARGEPLYTSEQLSRLWSVDGRSMGFCTLGEVTFDSAVYCAKYALKRLNVSENSPPEVKAAYDRRYLVYDEDGVILCEREREFAVMSRRPGIGAGYYEKYGKEVAVHDSVVINGVEVRPPRFYDTRTEVCEPDLYDKAKKKRKREAVLAKKDNTLERLRVKETLMLMAAKKKERRL